MLTPSQIKELKGHEEFGYEQIGDTDSNKVILHISISACLHILYICTAFGLPCTATSIVAGNKRRVLGPCIFIIRLDFVACSWSSEHAILPCCHDDMCAAVTRTRLLRSLSLYFLPVLPVPQTYKKLKRQFLVAAETAYYATGSSVSHRPF